MLKICVEAIQQHSAFSHEVVIHINEGSDGTLDWVKTISQESLVDDNHQRNNIRFTHSHENIGICKAMNEAFGIATQDYILYLNDDMYVLPNWDKYLLEEIKTIGNQLFMLSSTLIEPTPPRLNAMIYGNYGRDITTFKKEALLKEFSKTEIPDWSGSSWPPLVVSRASWLMIGGFSIEFSPGMYSDPDLSMKMWHAGCRIFKGLSKSRVYHFQSRSTGRVKKNNGRLQFMQKWGLPASAFYKHYLKMGKPYKGYLTDPTIQNSFVERIVLKAEKIKARLRALIG